MLQAFAFESRDPNKCCILRDATPTKAAAMAKSKPVRATEHSSAWKERAKQKWEKDVEACAFALLPQKKALDKAEVLLAMEVMASSPSGEKSEDLAPYVRCAAAVAKVLTEKGLLSEDEVVAALGPRETNEKPKFKAGDHVTVSSDRLRHSQWPRPYHTMTGFLYGAEGRVAKFVEVRKNDAAVAFGAEAASQPFYEVTFALDDIWIAPESSPIARGATIETEVPEAWLEPVDPIRRIQDSWPKKAKKQKTGDRHHQDHQGGFDYAHPPVAGQDFASALVDLLVEKKIVSASEISEAVSNREKELLEYKASTTKSAKPSASS